MRYFFSNFIFSIFAFSEFSGKKIEVNIQTVKNQREFEDTYVDLSHVINMDIEEEDDI